MIASSLLSASLRKANRFSCILSFKSTTRVVRFDGYQKVSIGDSAWKNEEWDEMYFCDKIDATECTFEKVLIANRGEIACRIIKTAKRMGIKTVALYSEIDHSSLHVRLADEAICIGPAPAVHSYLNIENIVAAAKRCGAEAVHPGYGFLSENAHFVSALDSAGISFIGPSANNISKMGDKLRSKQLAKDADVNTIPGYDGIIKDASECVRISRQLGYPVMIKASAGGGGKGMRIAYNDGEVRDGFLLSSQEAASSFGDDRIIVEKYIDNPRHIEIQVLCDKHGNAIYLNERECSIQRRNQKVIEEAPSTFVNDEMRRSMGMQAVSLCKRIEYSSAGTVEFLVDDEKKFYFLEMNTRLQVEHPVTEFTTGIDLIHQSFRIAKGHKLKHTQSDIGVKGWAIECRIYAEDPYKNFGLPSVGLLYKYVEPRNISSVRFDSGVTAGSEISIYYDPMICKLICHGETRSKAIQKSLDVLDRYVIKGVTHNIPLIRDILTEPNFVAGNISTDYLRRVYGSSGFKGRKLNKKNTMRLACFAAVLFAKMDLRCYDLVNTSMNEKKIPSTWSVVVDLPSNVDGDIAYDVVLRGDMFEVTAADGATTYNVRANNFNITNDVVEMELDNEISIVQIISKSVSGSYEVSFEGTTYKCKVLAKRVADFLKLFPKKEADDVAKMLIAPMPGLVRSVNCKVDDDVIEGQELCVIEAMKMHNSLKSPNDGKIKAVNISTGQTVSDGDVLLEFF